MIEIDMNKEEAKKFAELLLKQVELADEGTDVEIEILPHDISVTVKWNGSWFRSGFYRKVENALALSVSESIKAGKKLKKALL